MANIRERIDRAWCNLRWHHAFGNATVQHLPRVESDHHPLLLAGLTPWITACSSGFRFLESWYCHPSFGKVVEDS